MIFFTKVDIVTETLKFIFLLKLIFNWHIKIVSIKGLPFDVLIHVYAV
jgi:hypothetical protein